MEEYLPEYKLLSELTEDDIQNWTWFHLDWLKNPVCVRGVRITQPPDDGYEYTEITSFGDYEQKWQRGKKKGEA